MTQKDAKKQSVTDGPTDGRTDRPTDGAGCRVACTRLKKRRRRRLKNGQGQGLSLTLCLYQCGLWFVFAGNSFDFTFRPQFKAIFFLYFFSVNLYYTRKAAIKRVNIQHSNTKLLEEAYLLAKSIW